VDAFGLANIRRGSSPIGEFQIFFIGQLAGFAAVQFARGNQKFKESEATVALDTHPVKVLRWGNKFPNCRPTVESNIGGRRQSEVGLIIGTEIEHAKIAKIKGKGSENLATGICMTTLSKMYQLFRQMTTVHAWTHFTSFQM